MKETGTITKISDKTVTVKVKRRNECSKCGLCGMKDGQSEMDFIASYGDYQNNLAVGDTVVVEVLAVVNVVELLVHCLAVVVDVTGVVLPLLVPTVVQVVQ